MTKKETPGTNINTCKNMTNTDTCKESPIIYMGHCSGYLCFLSIPTALCKHSFYPQRNKSVKTNIDATK